MMEPTESLICECHALISASRIGWIVDDRTGPTYFWSLVFCPLYLIDQHFRRNLSGPGVPVKQCCAGSGTVCTVRNSSDLVKIGNQILPYIDIEYPSRQLQWEHHSVEDDYITRIEYDTDKSWFNQVVYCIVSEMTTGSYQALMLSSEL